MIQVLQTIGLVLGIAFYAAAGFCLVSGWIRLRRMERKFDSLHGMQCMMFAMQMDGNIKENLQQMKRMSEEMQKAIDEDRYEDAQHIQRAIEDRKHYIAEQIAYIQEEFSDECEVKMYNRFDKLIK